MALDSDDSDQDLEPKVNKKRKRSGAAQTRTKRTSTSTGTPRGKALIRLQLELIEQRKNERTVWLQNNTWHDHDHLSSSTSKEVLACCLRCSIKAYRQAIINGDMHGLKKLLEDTKTYPSWRTEDRSVAEDNALKLAASLGNQPMIDVLMEDTTKRILLSPSLTTYASNTGFVSRFTFGHAVKKVNESRGNRQGNSAFYRTAYSDGFNVDVKFDSSVPNEFIALFHSPVVNDAEVIKCLSEKKTSGEYSYHVVASGNHVIAAKILQDKGTSYGFNLLHHATLMDKELPAHRKNQILKKAYTLNNLSPVMCASINPSADHLKTLFQQLEPAERVETDDLGRTVAHYAAASTTPDCLEYLISQSYNFSQGDKFRLTPLLQMARFGRADNIRPLLKYLSNDTFPCTDFADQTLLRNRRRPLHYAANFGHSEACKALIDCGATVDILESSLKATPLMLASLRGHLDCVKTLIEYGHAGIHLVDKYARSPLHLACIEGHYQVAKYLLMQGLETNAHDSSSNTPAHYAAAFGHLDVVKLLVEFGGADPSSNNVWRATPCSVANLKGHIAIVQYLLSLPDGNVNVDFKDEDGYTMLHRAVTEKVTTPNEINQNLRRIQVLLDKNANVNTTTINGDTVLHVLARANYYNGHRLEKVDGVNVVADDETCIEYQRKVYQLLLDAGADVHAGNNEKNTALSLAMGCRNYAVVPLLIKDQAKYWSDLHSTGNSFFHGLFYAAARLDNVRLSEGDQVNTWAKHDIIRLRYVKEFEDIWQAIQTHPIPADQTNQIMIDYVNDDGYTALLEGIFKAIKLQKKFVAREKSIVKDESAPRYHYGSRITTTEVSSERRPMRFVFKFDSFYIYAKKILEQFSPDMNAVVKLPKDYLKKNPKAKPENYPQETGCGALQLAAHTQHASLLNLLLTHGTNPNQQSKNIKHMCGATALASVYFTRHDNDSLYLSGDTTIAKERINKMFAIVMPDFETDLYDSLKVLLQYGANPCLVDGKGESALMKVAKALDAKAAKMMCDSSSIISPIGGVDSQGVLEQRDGSGSTALMIALSSYIFKYKNSDDDKDKIDMKAITHIVSAGADPNATYENGDTVFMKAFRLGYYPLVKTIMRLAQTPLNHMAQNKVQETPLILACKSRKARVLELYLEHLEKDHKGGDLMDIRDCVNALDVDHNGPLALAASNGDLNGVRALLEYQANPNNTESKKNPLFEAIKAKHYEVVEALLSAGANVNAQDSKTGSSALHYAVKSEKIALVRVLLKHGASPTQVDKMMQTPLHWAIQLSKNQTNRSMRVERLLLQAGADINASDVFGRTPLHIVFTGLHSIPWMQTTNLTYKKVKLLMEERKLAEEEEQKIKQYVNTYGRISGGLDTWLEEHKRSAIEQEKARKALEENQDSDKDNSNIVLSINNRMTLAKYLDFQFEQDGTVTSSDPVDMLKDLMDTSGIELDSIDSFGRTPFHYAVIVDAISCVNMMLDSKQMDIKSQDYDANGGVQLALRYGHSNMAVMVHNRGGIASDITFPDGKKQSAISYSLAHSYMNVSYHFMSNTETVLKSLSDALIKGKFHFAHTLLRNAEDSVLGGVISSTDQNLWHVISNFRPFDVEMWNDYLSDFLEKMEELDLKRLLDKNNCSPLHYAALHGQETLLKHLLTLDPQPQLTFDATDFQSQVWAAVSSNNINCVKLLLDAGLPLTEGNNHTKPSILLTAVSNDNVDMVKLLLEHGVDMDADSDYGRRNSVMWACVQQKNIVLQVLVDGGANVDKPSTITRRLKGKVYSMVTYPIFVASIHGPNTTLRILLKASANPNIVGPKDENVEMGRSCLMFNICKEKTENVKLLLAHGANVNIKDDYSDRSAFYRVFFEKETLPCSNEVYEMVFKHTPGPDVNIVDTETGMVPLEVAIRNHDIALVDRLLVLGADPNIASCKKKLEPTDLYNDVVNALFHCILNDDFDILEVLCKTTQYDIDWAAVDSEGRTIFSRIVDVDNGYGYKNDAILDYIVKHIGKTRFKKIVEIADHHGNRPTQLALRRNRKDHFDALVRHGAKSTTLDADMIQDDTQTECPMDVEQISLETVEKDAESERVLLQALVDSQKTISDQPTTEENKVEIDPYSQLERVGTMVFDQGEPFDIMILKVEVQSYLHSSNMFYKMSVIYNKLLDLYVLWTRWGAFGEEGMHQKTPYLTQEEAVAEFKSIFKSKTGNAWEQRTDFVEKPGRYQLIKARDPAKDAILDNVDVNFIHNEIQPTALPNNLHNTMKLFCNFSTLKNAYKNISLDIPIGQIPPESIREATAILNRLEIIATQLADSSLQAKRKELIHEAIQGSSRYYRLLPINNPNNKSGLRPILTQDMLNKERSRLNDARYINFTLNVVLAAKHRAKEINPFDYSYRSLGCQLAEVEPGCREFNVVSKYMSSTSKDSGYEIAHLFSVNRDQETERFKPFASDKNRKLLWHGSQLGNFMGILNQGLRSKPAAAYDSGSLYGNGIYFADMFCKSVDFATNIYGSSNPAYGLLLLCEVALGEECPSTPNNTYKYDNEKEEKGYTSIKGLGKEGPNLSNALYDTDGVMIPMGPSVNLEVPEEMESYAHRRTTYNEYVVRDEARVKIRYMVLVRHNDYCFLCQSRRNRRNLKSLEDHELKAVTWKDVNTFEQQIFDMYLSNIEKTPKEYFDEQLPSFLENQNTNESLQKWCLPLDIERTSKVCEGCADKMVTIMITKELQDLQKSNSTEDGVVSTTGKYPFFDLEYCRNGRECELQHKSINHAKTYQHWHPKKTNVKDDDANGTDKPTEDMDLDVDNDYVMASENNSGDDDDEDMDSEDLGDNDTDSDEDDE
ncbi:unnamed protein product [Absidia cylindrospora]